MSNAISQLNGRDYATLLTVIKTLRLFEQLAAEHNPNLGTVETELVASTMKLLANQLEQIMGSIDSDTIHLLEQQLAS